MRDLAVDGEQYEVDAGGQRWLVSWHAAASPAPDGRAHGSAAVCFTDEGEIVLVSADGESWGLPGGRPDGAEDWHATMVREMLEGACAFVTDATLLGYTRSECTDGWEQGLVLVRSFWCASVVLGAWDPHDEIAFRRIVTPDVVVHLIAPPEGVRPIYERILREAFDTQYPPPKTQRQ